MFRSILIIFGKLLNINKADIKYRRIINRLNAKTYFMYQQFQHSKIQCPAHITFMCFEWISEKTAIISLYTIYLSVFITEAESVYCAVRTGSLNHTGTVSSFRVTYIKICAEKVFVDIMKFVCSCEELVHKMRGL